MKNSDPKTIPKVEPKRFKNKKDSRDDIRTHYIYVQDRLVYV